MASELEMLKADIREVQAHLGVWPDDSFGLKRLAALTAVLEALTPPSTSDQRKSTLRGDAFGRKAAERYGDAPSNDLERYAQRKSTLRGVRATQFIVDEPHAEVKPAKAPWNKGFVVPAPDDVQEVVARNREKYKVEGDGAPRFTFGEDYEMDQRWLAAERDKAGLLQMMRDHGGVEANRPATPSEADMYLFPTMAYNLTSLHNMKYGTSRY